MCVHPNIVPCFDSKEIRELGMTLVINARKKAPPLHLYKALLMAQVKPPFTDKLKAAVLS